MSFKKTILSSVTAVALLSSAAFAVDMLEKDGTGDYLVMPAYYAIGTWSTEVKVVNTNTTHAIIAKVVVREGTESEEWVDFPVYLTPGDVWTATISATDTDYVVTSTDDSMIIRKDGEVSQASAADPIVITRSKSTHDVCGDADYTCWNGYVEVFGVASYPGTTIDADWKVETPLDKATFFSYVRNTTERIDTVTGVDVSYRDLNISGATDVKADDLMGKQTVTNTSATDIRSMTLNAVALADIVPVRVEDRATDIINNIIQADTTLTTMVGLANVTTARTNLEDSLAKDEIYVMYEGNGAGDVGAMRTHFTDSVKKYEEGLRAYDSYTYLYGARNMSEVYSDCTPNQEGDGDVSGEIVDYDIVKCGEEVEVELYYFGTSEITAEGATADGGYMTYSIDLDKTIIPTTFTATQVGTTRVNNHISNQYKIGTYVAGE